MPRSSPTRALLALAAALACLAFGPAVDARQHVTTRVTRAAEGGLPDGPATNPAVSDDQRDASILAFQSTATNLVSRGTPAGQSNVYYIPRHGGGPFDQGTAWRPGRTVLISHRPDGGPANGSSSAAAPDGFTSYSPKGPSLYEPHCIVFLSAASNLVRGDTNHKTDAFVYWLRSRRIERVSLASGGRQANGTTSQVAVNGTCSEVAFTSDATNLAHGTHGRREVYVRYLGGLEPGTAAPQPGGLRGKTQLVSADHGRAANRDSFDAAFAKKTPGDLVFASRATNLAAGTHGHSEVYLYRGGGSELISSRGAPANGDSDEPAIQDDGSWVAFRTAATNLAGSGHGHTQIVRTATGSHRFEFVSRNGGIGNGDSSEPRISNRGFYVSYQTDATNLGCGPGVYLYTGVRRLSLCLAGSSGAAAAPDDPAVSQFANYAFYDAPEKGRPDVRQIFLNYLGRE